MDLELSLTSQHSLSIQDASNLMNILHTQEFRDEECGEDSHSGDPV
jgi:hypothetical protein